MKKYSNNEEGKKTFVEEVINTLVVNESHFVKASYEKNTAGEYIKLNSLNDKILYIDITADSIEAVVRDFCKNFLKAVEKITTT